MERSDDFFGLYDGEVMSKQRRPTVDDSYDVGDAIVTVMRLNGQGEPSELKVVMGKAGDVGRVFVWRDGGLMSLQPDE